MRLVEKDYHFNIAVLPLFLWTVTFDSEEQCLKNIMGLIFLDGYYVNKVIKDTLSIKILYFYKEN